MSNIRCAGVLHGGDGECIRELDTSVISSSLASPSLDASERPRFLPRVREECEDGNGWLAVTVFPEELLSTLHFDFGGSRVWNGLNPFFHYNLKRAHRRTGIRHLFT